tara:strand:- start:644 stop:1927 length:1284 start_codon:yes stop_codon:yes gene_type:complete
MFKEEKKSSQTSQDSDVLSSPSDEIAASKIIKAYFKSGTPLELLGSGSKRLIGNKLQCEKTLSLSKLDGIIRYQPEESYIKVKACTPIKTIEEKLKMHKQCLAFDPVDLGYIFKGESDQGTAAGCVATNFAGSSRFKYGSVRDHLLGFRGINGKGEIIKSGGTVVKNVTGYDLSKLVCGSYGTLVALTELTFKVIPLQEDANTIVLYDLSIESASEFLKNVSQSSNDVTGAVHLPITSGAKNFETNIENIFKLNDLKSASSYTAIRLEGSQVSIKEKIENIKKELNLFESKMSVLESYQSKLFWQKIKNLEIFSNTKNSVLRIVVSPSSLVKTIYYLEKLTSQCFVDWAGNLLWTEIKNLSKENLIVLKKFVSNSDGYITLIKSGEGLNFYDQAFTTNKIHYNISQKIKESFDPKRILNPNKMYSGI